MTHIERLQYLIEKWCGHCLFNGEYLCKIDSDRLFHFDDWKENKDIESIEMDVRKNIFVKFKGDSKKYNMSDMSDDEQSLLITCLG